MHHIIARKFFRSGFGIDRTELASHTEVQSLSAADSHHHSSSVVIVVKKRLVYQYREIGRVLYCTYIVPLRYIIRSMNIYQGQME